MTTWVLLRGLTRESGHWGAFVDQFQQAMPDCRLVTLDLSGNGSLWAQRSPTQVAEMVEHARAQLLGRHLAPPWHVLAMSLGAMVAVAWAQAHPEEMAAQVLINTSLRPFSAFYQRLRPANYGALLTLALGFGSPEQQEHAVLRLTSNQAHPDVLAHWLALRQAHPVSRTNALRQVLAASRFRASGQAPSVPTLLLASANDHLVDAACSRTLATRWQCPLLVHPTAGHDLPLDDGAWVVAAVRDFVASRSGA